MANYPKSELLGFSRISSPFSTSPILSAHAVVFPVWRWLMSRWWVNVGTSWDLNAVMGMTAQSSVAPLTTETTRISMGQVLFNPYRSGVPRITKITRKKMYQEIKHVEQTGGYSWEGQELLGQDTPEIQARPVHAVRYETINRPSLAILSPRSMDMSWFLPSGTVSPRASLPDHACIRSILEVLVSRSQDPKRKNVGAYWAPVDPPHNMENRIDATMQIPPLPPVRLRFGTGSSSISILGVYAS
jgi:hypothetical protein